MSVAFRLRRPTAENLRGLVESEQGGALTYEPIGLTELGAVPAGYRREHWTRRLESGEATFRAAVEAIRTWQVHRGAGLTVYVDGPPTEDQVVAMSAPLPIGYVEAVCRVVAVIDETDRIGFTYGTLRIHPARGEESFAVVRSSDGTATFEVTAVSRPNVPLAALVSPVARRLQHSAATRYLDAMARATSGAASRSG